MRHVLLVAVSLFCFAAPHLLAQQPPRVYTIQELFTRNVGSAKQGEVTIQETAFTTSCSGSRRKGRTPNPELTPSQS